MKAWIRAKLNDSEILRPKADLPYSKICTRCHEEKRRDEFYVQERYLSSRCKRCIGAVAKRAGVSREDYQRMLEKQEYRCKICGRDEGNFKRGLMVDHDHKTKQIRGLLCLHCNFMLGHARDRVGILQRGISYLQSNQQIASLAK